MPRPLRNCISLCFQTLRKLQELLKVLMHDREIDVVVPSQESAFSHEPQQCSAIHPVWNRVLRQNARYPVKLYIHSTSPLISSNNPVYRIEESNTSNSPPVLEIQRPTPSSPSHMRPSGTERNA